MKKIAWFSLFLLPFVHYAQSGWKAKIYGGYLISHHPEMQNMESHISAIEVSKYWTLEHTSDLYDKMKLGIAANYMHLGRDQINGSAISILPHIQVQLNKNRKAPFSMRWATGLGYITNPFQFPDNIQNKAIGTRLNGAMQILFSKNWEVKGSQQLGIGAGLTHFSNANFRKPNLGINMPHLFLNWNLISNNDAVYRPKERNVKRGRLFVELAYSKREIAIDDPQPIHIYTLSGTYSLRRKSGQMWRFGTDIFFDRSYSYQKFEANSMNNSLEENAEHGLRAGYHWKVGRTGLILDMGLYTYRPSPVKRRYYTIVGVNFDLTQDVSAFVKMKTHLSVADYFLWGFAMNVFNHE